jgi:multimeric flavodoxin WrbA
MKALLINGSPIKGGNTHRALEEIAAQLKKHDIDSEIYWIGTKPVRGCVDCCTCRRTGSGKCVFNDDICNEVIERVNVSDALVVGSPVYYGAPAGPVMSLLQRVMFAGAKVDGKPAAAVTICRRGGATSAFQTLQMPFQMMNMPLVTSQYWNIVYGCQPGEVAQDAEGLQTMRTLADNLAWLLQATAGKPTPEREPWTRTNFI